MIDRYWNSCSFSSPLNLPETLNPEILKLKLRRILRSRLSGSSAGLWDFGCTGLRGLKLYGFWVYGFTALGFEGLRLYGFGLFFGSVLRVWDCRFFSCAHGVQFSVQPAGKVFRK